MATSDEAEIHSSLYLTASSTTPNLSRVSPVDEQSGPASLNYYHQADNAFNTPFTSLQTKESPIFPTSSQFETQSLSALQFTRTNSLNPCMKQLRESRTIDVSDTHEYSPSIYSRMTFHRHKSIPDSQLDQEFIRELRMSEEDSKSTVSQQEALERADSEVTNCQKILLQRQMGKMPSVPIGHTMKPTKVPRRILSADAVTSPELSFARTTSIENLPLLNDNSPLGSDKTYNIRFPTRHGSKDASYIILPGVVPDSFMDTIRSEWNLFPPTIILSFPGDAQLSNNSRFRQVLKDNIIRIAATTKVWFLTEGINRNVSAFLGSCLQSHAYKRCAKREQNQRGWLIDNCGDYDNPVPIIGIVRPDTVHKGNELMDNTVGPSMTYSRESRNDVLEKDLLDVNHSHFILLNKFKPKDPQKPKADPWFRVEDRISSYLKLPVVRIIVDDTLQVITKVWESVMNDVVTVVISSNNVMRVIHDFIFRLAARDQKIGDKEKGNFLSRCRHLLGNEPSSTINGMIEKINEVIAKFHLVTMFDMNLTYGADLSKALVVALLKSKPSTGKDKLKEALALVIDWNRVDLAEQDIFTESLIWGDNDLFPHFFKILHLNQFEFLDLMLERNVIDLTTFVEHHLEKLYFDAAALNSNSPLFAKLVENSNIDKHQKKPLFSWRWRGTTTKQKESIALKEIKGDNNIIPIDQIGKLIKYIMNRSFKSIYEEYFQGEEERKIISAHPIDNLLIWAVLTQRWKMAEILLNYSNSVIFNALAAKALISGMYIKLKDEQVVSENDLEILQEVAKKFELTAVGIMEEVYRRDSKKAHLILQERNKLFDENDCIEMAVSGHCMTFLSHPCVQTLLDQQWKEPLYRHNPLWKRLLAMCCPFLIFYIIEFSEPRPTGFQYLKFYYSPSNKFLTHVFSFMLYLLLYCYVVLFKWYPFPNLDPSEWIFIFWSITIVAEEARQLFGGSGRLGKRWLSYFRDRWNQFDIVFVVFFLVGTVLRLIPQIPIEYSRHMYAFFGFILFFRILQFLVILRDSGPFVYMVFRMLKNLTHFVVLAVIFLLAYGVPSQVILYPNIPRFSNGSFAFVIGNIFFRPYFQAFGEFFLGHVASNSNTNSQSSFGSSNPEIYLSSQIFVYIFLLIWIILSNILLVNLIIAKFNNTFVEIESNAALYWKYKFFNSVTEFRDKPVLPPPFNIIVIAFRLIKKMFMFFSTCNSPREVKDYCDDECQEIRKLFEYEKRCVLAFKFNTELTHERNLEDRLSHLDDRLMNTQQLIVSMKGKIDNLQFNSDIMFDPEREQTSFQGDQPGSV